MFKNIIGTATARVVNAFITLAVLLVNTNNLGKEGLGTIGLIVLGITIILLINNYIGGGALVYLVPRQHTGKLLIPSYFWSILISVSAGVLLGLLKLVPDGYVLHVIILSLFFSLSTANLNILIGKEKITLFNTISVFQLFTTLLVLCFLIYVREYHDVMAYVYALYAGYSISFIFSLIAISRYIRFPGRLEIVSVVKEILKYGKFIQTANVLQLLNYRLSYYIIEFFMGRASLGLYNVGVQLSEGVWLIGKSVAMVQYARISNMDDRNKAVQLTLRLLKFTFLLTVIVLGALIAIPETTYVFIFGDDFAGIKLVIISLAIGILSTAVSMMFSHYFTGIGKPKYNMIGSLLGLVFTLVLGLIFIPKFGLVAAGLTASASYFVNLSYLFIVFKKLTKIRTSSLLIEKEDFKYIIRELRFIFCKR